MSKKFVIPTLETQQKYPLFYAEATKTINDIIEHISKERGIYISNIEPDPKEYLIWFNTNFNIIYFYDEKTKSFIPATGGSGDLSTIYTVSDKNELFDIDFNRGIYKVEEYNKNNNIKNFYILTVGGKSAIKNYKLYGNNGIFIQTTINDVKQFISVDLNNDNILEIIGSGKFSSNLEDASTITDAINILSSIIGETDNGDTDLTFMGKYPILTYLRYINDALDINYFSNIVAHDEKGRKVAKMFTDLQTLVSNIDTDKQNKVDNSLTTTDKTIVGAINELHSLILSLQK